MPRPTRRSKTTRGMASLGELVPRVYPSKEPEELRLLRAIAWWDTHVPPRITKNARPVKMVRGALVVHATSSAWAQELTLLLPVHAEALARAVPGIDPAKIRVQAGPLPPRPTAPRAHRPKVEPLSLDALPEAVARGLSTIADDALRDAVARAAAQSLAPRRPR